MLPNEDKEAALDSVKTLFSSSSNGSSLADSLIKSGDFETLANIAEAGSSILNDGMKSTNKSKNATSEQLEAEFNETLNRINVSFVFLTFTIQYCCKCCYFSYSLTQIIVGKEAQN